MSVSNNSSIIPLKVWAKIYTGGKGKKSCYLNQLIIGTGNIKIPSTTAIFNMSSATDCPSKRLGLCKAEKQGCKCYAIKSEYNYRPYVLPFRRQQEAYWKEVNAFEFVSQFLLLNAMKEKPFNALRLNESGDFHSQECVTKAESIALILRRFGIVTYCYTSRSDLDFSKVKHLVISGSGFQKKGITNEFKIVFDISERPKGYGVCKGNCKICKRCSIRGMKTVVKKH